MSSGRVDPRLEALLEALEHMAGGDLERRVPISPLHDQVDAVAHGVNVLAGELRYAEAGLRQAKHDAEEANRAKSSFLRNISHELRTPLSAILGEAALLREAGVSAAQRDELVARILSNGRALLALVDELLDLSRVEAGKLELVALPIDPLAAVREALASLETDARRKGLRLSIDSAATLPESILTDGRRLRQILINVIGNATKFTERGGVTVRLAPSSDGRWLEIDVADTGIGLAPEQARVLFAPFQQGDPSIAQRFGGTGLGLALSKRLAQGLGGDLAIAASAPGIGTTFQIRLPLGHVEAPPAPAPAPAAHPARGRIAGMRLLLAEDIADIREPMARLLELAGATVTEAADGLTAVTLGATGAFDLILMDVRMPGVDGLEATRRLRKQGLRLPIVALTADAVAEQRAECLAAGCDDYLTKPVELDRLMKVVARYAKPRE